MLSTQYRLRLQAICKDIAAGTEVTLEDMIWAEKLSKVNTSARGMLSQARRLSTDEDGSCLKYLDIGDSNPKNYTWWSYRARAKLRNKGWRIDYHMISADLLKMVKSAYIMKEVSFSDHCPIVLKIF